MIDVLRLSQSKTLTATGILEAARDRVKQQIAAKSLASIMCGFAEDGMLIHYANLDYPSSQAFRISDMKSTISDRIKTSAATWK